MHSFDWSGKAWPEQGSDPGSEVDTKITMLHNGDYSGNVEVILLNKIADVSVAHGAGPNGEGMAEVHIPFEAMKALVLNYLRTEIVGFAEEASDEAFELVLRGLLNVQDKRSGG